MLAEIFGPDFLIVVLVVVVLIFGGAAIPKLARNLGAAQGEFKKGLAEAKADTEASTSQARDVSTNGAKPADGTASEAKPEGAGSAS